MDYADDGGRLVVVGEIGGPGADDITNHENTVSVKNLERGASIDELRLAPPQVTLTTLPHGAVNLQHPADDVVTLHIVNYDYDVEAGITPSALDVRVEVALPSAPTRAALYAPGQATPLELEITASESGETSVVIPSIGTYVIVEFRR
ncbi:hypothetical protein [Frondihabitans sucicola]|uniref:hypothetical protein n=1 Tax=Frondihabitans sucicola TaxID=1268041 RepID=UPI002572CD08|nr:hypothetical protein [Frondihabitans sucicola]